MHLEALTLVHSGQILMSFDQLSKHDPTPVSRPTDPRQRPSNGDAELTP